MKQAEPAFTSLVAGLVPGVNVVRVFLRVIKTFADFSLSVFKIAKLFLLVVKFSGFIFRNVKVAGLSTYGSSISLANYGS
jgi:hypothetical protein